MRYWLMKTLIVLQTCKNAHVVVIKDHSMLGVCRCSQTQLPSGISGTSTKAVTFPPDKKIPSAVLGLAPADPGS
jgi:hypothetical protein